MSSGLLQSAQSLLGSLLALARTRLELFSTELQEALARLFFTLIGAVALLLLVALGAGFAGLALVLGLGEEHRALAAGIVALAFLVLAFAAGWSLRRLGAGRPRLLEASLGELEHDYRALKS